MKSEICLQHVISVIRLLDGAKLSRACVLNAAVERAGNYAKSVQCSAKSAENVVKGLFDSINQPMRAAVRVIINCKSDMSTTK